jgi:hypothetical protein
MGFFLIWQREIKSLHVAKKKKNKHWKKEDFKL